MSKQRQKFKIDLILHPVRMRIIMALAGQQMTPQELSSSLPDVPQATLYRHINKLTEGGVIMVTEERPVRGTVEKVYALPSSGATLTPEDLQEATKDDHMRFFVSFVATLLDDFARYLRSDDDIDLMEDGVGYRKIPLFLSKEELAEFGKALNEAARPYFDHKPSPGRTRRLFTTILMPDQE